MLATIADATRFEREGFVFRPLAVPSRGSSEVAVWTLDIAPSSHSEVHSMDREEVFVVVSGTVSATVGDAEYTAEPGDAIIVPRNTVLQIRNPCPENPAVVTAVTTVGMHATVGDATFPPPWAQ